MQMDRLFFFTMEKTYRFRIGFGDGKPIEIELLAKSGYLAWEQIRKDHPYAKSIHILGRRKSDVDEIPIQRLDLVVPDKKPHPLFCD